MKIIFKYWNTLKYLKKKQLSGQVLNKLGIRSKIKSIEPILTTRSKVRGFVSPITREGIQLSESEFCFLNQQGTVRVSNDWKNKSKGDLWNYNLHYFDYLNSRDISISTQEQIDFISKWIKENKIMHGIGWDPYPTSLRLVNWIKWSLQKNLSQDHFLGSITNQARFLYRNLETHILGNHLFANAKALIFSGLFLDHPEADKWLKKGFKIIHEEINEQILKDGGHFELSPMYHSIILEDILDIYNLCHIYDHKFPSKWIEILKKMFSWIAAMTHPDGKLSFFNDSAFGIAPTLLELKSYAERLDIKVKTDNKNNLSILKESGYGIVNYPDLYLITDVGNIGPDYLLGHAHADSLSFEMSLFKNRLIVNSGISTYAEDPDLRDKQRATAAHSALEINGINSSEVWSIFRVARRADTNNLKFLSENDQIKIEANHNGYSYLKGKPIHLRR